MNAVLREGHFLNVSFQALEENNSLIKENSQLCAKISLLELELDRLKKENENKEANEVSAGEIAEVCNLENLKKNCFLLAF